jgi:hypothetical protein
MQQEMSLLQLAELLLQFCVIPLGAFMWMHYKMSQDHAVTIAVMKSEYILTKEGHDRELKEIKELFTTIFKKLDEIQRDLHK